MRLIDADKIQEEYKQEHDGKRLLLIDVAPTVDAVPVVRCKDWVNFSPIKFSGCTFCANLNRFVYDDWFCADGERREDAGV